MDHVNAAGAASKGDFVRPISQLLEFAKVVAFA
jgi:hypothetical protein